MVRVKISKNFYLDEFFSKELYLSETNRCVNYIDSRVVAAAQLMRDIVREPIFVNTWYDVNQGSLSNCRVEFGGFRPLSCKVGVVGGQHYWGRAVDLWSPILSYNFLRDSLLEHEQDFMNLGITSYESAPGTHCSLHLDCRAYLNQYDKLIAFSII
jgi:hypothetical protein